MKKSEKIEVRLSHDEKQKLTEIADGEGRSVSELVRGLISRYMAVNAPIVKKTAWGKITAVAIAGLLLGHLGTWALMRGHDSGHRQAAGTTAYGIFELNIIATNILTDGRLASNAMKMPIVGRDGNAEQFVMERQGDDLQIDTQVTIKDDSLSWIDVTICRKIKRSTSGKEIASKQHPHNRDACKYVARQRLLMSAAADASVEIATEKSDLIAIGLAWTDRYAQLKSLPADATEKGS